jgi:putative transcriptional regulator
METVQNLVREFRTRLGLTQEELAERAGVWRQTIISIESGRYNPTITLAYKLARIFHTSIEELFLCADQIDTEDNHE